MKKTFMTLTLVLGLITFINAQGITNTLGGNTANDKFIVENSDSEAGLVVTGTGNVGIGTTSPSTLLHGRGAQSFYEGLPNYLGVCLAAYQMIILILALKLPQVLIPDIDFWRIVMLDGTYLMMRPIPISSSF